jgi:hypothetical protein
MMRSQVSVEIMVGMLIALAMALFLSTFAASAGAAFARNEHALAGVANSVSGDMEGMLRSIGAGGG